jgi:hypothetical protein
MKRRIRPLLLAAALISLPGLMPAEEPRPHTEQSCVYYFGQCVMPEYLVGFIHGSIWHPFPH